ncbi:cyclic nucleotide-binding domain-containing protein [Aromatoleum petrolei]|uniref:Cyclic nucleotide-binding domain-containing protein n=1 Tax=Aromatoleum petrolei TaxID=76116 RepID=A0ABX1MUR1_9RHOO|nr:cyclic nucleotide-binding domain-containing protein [Aromatoleum petrolei]NMF91503.1 cyclic nucleotide-binding domain-containing protein [Aromatoleum petrolei]QTQ34412.1 Cyclic nucleotide-binding domain-containing protein [Aromatoleum petrolei]
MQGRAERILRLQQMPLFGGIRADMLDFLLGRCAERAVLAGAFVFREGEPAESMFVLEAGSVAVRRHACGGEVVLCTLGPGACFGEMALIDLSPRSATVQALEDCRALEIFAANLFELYERDVEQFALIQMNIARELSRRLRLADDRAGAR